MTTAINAFGYDLIRNVVLRDLLGEDHDSILYWIGKSLARKHRLELETVDELVQFFAAANWGTLTLLKETNRKKVFELTGEWMGKDDERCYQLEAGFLAQQYEFASESYAVTTIERKKRAVIFTVQLERI
mgnify:CR=1 FL=1